MRRELKYLELYKKLTLNINPEMISKLYSIVDIKTNRLMLENYPTKYEYLEVDDFSYEELILNRLSKFTSNRNFYNDIDKIKNNISKYIEADIFKVINNEVYFNPYLYRDKLFNSKLCIDLFKDSKFINTFKNGFISPIIFDIPIRVGMNYVKNINKTKGFVYIMKDSSKYIKIGKTINIINRYSSLQTGNPTIKLIGYKYFFDCDSKELEMHNKFKNNRFIGEWFNISTEDALLELDK